MKQHKWHKEIKAWADGAEIEYQYGKCEWRATENPEWSGENYSFRIKPQPSAEPGYLYIFWEKKHHYSAYAIQQDISNFHDTTKWECVGKIKMESI